MAINSRIRTMASDFRGYSHQLQFLFGAGTLINDILSSVDRTWTVKRIISVDFARAVVAVGPGSSRNTEAVIKISRDREADRNLERERDILRRVRSDARLADLLPILPAELAWGAAGDHLFLVQSSLPGIDARGLLEDVERCARMQAAALETAALLHGQTARTVRVDGDLVKRWVDEPLSEIGGLRAWHPRLARQTSAIERLRESLTRSLMGREMAVSWLHGDFFPGNILVSKEGRTVTGLLDWDLAAPDELPVLDAMQLLIGIHLLRTGAELGPTILSLLDGHVFTESEGGAIAFAQTRLGGEPVTLDDAVLLTWLRHVACNLTKTELFKRHAWWVRENVERVLESLTSRVAP
jgi:Phosphotransferase enzyme family